MFFSTILLIITRCSYPDYNKYVIMLLGHYNKINTSIVLLLTELTSKREDGSKIARYLQRDGNSKLILVIGSFINKWILILHHLVLDFMVFTFYSLQSNNFCCFKWHA